MAAGIYYKIAGVWTQVLQPWIKVNGVWKLPSEVDFKHTGDWSTQLFVNDATPPSIPNVTLEIVDTSHYESGDYVIGSHIKVGVRLPDGSHQTDLQMIRVLTTYNNAAPTTQYGGTYTLKPDNDYPDEPWSDFSYNGYNNSSSTKLSNSYVYKNWPRNATNSTKLQGDTTYYFSAWAQDFAGNWSAVGAASIHVPKSGTTSGFKVVKEASFQPNTSGSITATAFTSGDLIQQGATNTTTRGIWFYGSQIKNQVGSQGAVTMKSAQIRVTRTNDNGQPSANVYLYWHDYQNSSSLPSDKSTVNYHTGSAAFLGTIAKGESKWFSIPDVVLGHIVAGDVYGFGLYNQDPAVVTPTVSDYSVVTGVSDDLRCGEAHLTWTEDLASGAGIG